MWLGCRYSILHFHQLTFYGHICKIEKSSELKCQDIGGSASSVVCTPEMRELYQASPPTLLSTFLYLRFLNLSPSFGVAHRCGEITPWLLHLRYVMSLNKTQHGTFFVKITSAIVMETMTTVVLTDRWWVLYTPLTWLALTSSCYCANVSQNIQFMGTASFPSWYYLHGCDRQVELWCQVSTHDLMRPLHKLKQLSTVDKDPSSKPK